MRILVPLEAPVALLVCPLHWIVQLKVFPSGSLMGMLQERFNGLLVDPFVGEGVLNTGGVLVVCVVLVVKVYHLRVYCLLPVRSVAFTQILKVVALARFERVSVLVPLVILVPPVTCLLLHCRVQE